MQEQHGLSEEEEEEEEEKEERLRSQQVVLDMVIKKGTESEMEIQSMELWRKRIKNHNKVFKNTLSK